MSSLQSGGKEMKHRILLEATNEEIIVYQYESELVPIAGDFIYFNDDGCFIVKEREIHLNKYINDLPVINLIGDMNK